MDILTMKSPETPRPSMQSAESTQTPRTSRKKGVKTPREKALVKVDEDSRRVVRKTSSGMTGSPVDFIPMDILDSLTHAPSPPGREAFIPHRHKKLQPLEVTSPVKSRPANVWNHPRAREKLRHLAEHPPCMCGAGRDISFIYDAVSEKDRNLKLAEKSARGLDKALQDIQPLEKSQTMDTISTQDERTFLTDVVDKALSTLEDGNEEQQEAHTVAHIPSSLLPSEYHIVKNPGVLGLEFHDDQYTTYVRSHQDHLTVFPSMKPSGRQEVLRLKNALDGLLKRAGIDDTVKELEGPTQIHNLLELIKKEQNIYNIAFNEIIRQTTVECIERGELLAEIRKRYQQLLDKVPRQVKSLHQEVLAQRALDRRLTEELIRFKSSVTTLTSELATVKAHDREVTLQAIQSQKDLQNALQESEKNASLLAEYHDLYELQRRRLEAQVGLVTEERDLWSSAAYTLALKVTERNSLSTAKRLHLYERAWSRLANHFAVFLSDKDSIQLQQVSEFVQDWRQRTDVFNNKLVAAEKEASRRLSSVHKQMKGWAEDFKRVISPDDGKVTIPDNDFVSNLCEDMKSWEEIFNEEAERFSGDVLLANEEELNHMNKKCEGWTDNALKIFSRHQVHDNELWPQHTEMLELNKALDQLQQQFKVRITGENGVARGLIHLMNPIETWINKLNSLIKGGDIILDPEWTQLADLLANDWFSNLGTIISNMGDPQREGGKEAGLKERIYEVEEVYKMSKDWMTATTNSIEKDDGRVVDQATGLHSLMIRWMVTALLRLVPDAEDESLKDIDKEGDATQSVGGGEILLESTTHEITERALKLFDRLTEFTTHTTKSCTDIVIDNVQERREQGDENAEMELKDLRRLRKECDGWVETAKTLVRYLLGDGETLEGFLAQESSSMSLVDVDKPPEETEKEKEDTAAGITISIQESEDKLDDESEEVIHTEEVDHDEEQEKGDEEQEKGEQHEEEAAQDQEKISDDVKEPAETETEAEPVERLSPEEKKAEERKEEKRKEGTQMHVLGVDENIQTKSLEDLPRDQALAGFPLADGSETDVIVRSPTPDTRKALEALAAVERLQGQLLETEERAQTAEERAIAAETELKQALEKLRALERTASRASDAKTPTTTSTPSTPVVEHLPAPPSPSTKQPSGSGHSQRSGTASRGSSRSSKKK